MTQPATLNPNQVTSAVEGEQTGTLPVMPIQFIPVTDLTTFAAEVAITEGDFVYHFYVTPEVNAGTDPHKYWLETFPQILEQTAKEYFKAEFPRVRAAYTEEKASWWMRAFGFGMVLDPHKLALSFCDALDSALDKATQNSK